jgi:hypothetical protein
LAALLAGPNEVKAVPTVQKQTPGLNDWHRFSPEMEAGLGRNTIWVVEQKLADRQFPTRRFSLRSLATSLFLPSPLSFLPLSPEASISALASALGFFCHQQGVP